MKMPKCIATNKECSLCNVNCTTMKVLNNMSPVEMRLFNNNTAEASYKRLTYLQVIEIQKILEK